MMVMVHDGDPSGRNQSLNGKKRTGIYSRSFDCFARGLGLDQIELGGSGRIDRKWTCRPCDRLEWFTERGRRG